MDRLPISKGATQKFYMKRLNLKKLKEAESQRRVPAANFKQVCGAGELR